MFSVLVECPHEFQLDVIQYSFQECIIYVKLISPIFLTRVSTQAIDFKNIPQDYPVYPIINFLQFHDCIILLFASTFPQICKLRIE